MPDTDPLSDLRRQLAIAMGPTTAMRSSPWVDPLPMRKVLRDVERHFDSVEAIPRQDTLRSTVQSFLKLGHAASFKELKYTCYGVTMAVDDKCHRLVDQPEALFRLLGQVDGERDEDRRFLRCYQALLQSYFSFAATPDHSATQLQEQASFQGLRGFLSDRLELVVRPIRGRVAGWAITLQEHRNLLTESPCQRYTDELAQGKTDQLADVCKGLGISRESWVWQEVILAYLRDVCQRDDRGFKQSLDQALDLSGSQTALTPSPATSRIVVAQVVKRYSEAAERPELPRLRDASIEQIGNPWLRRPAWDAWVRHEPARQMVDGWLKSKLMEDFFTLLSEKSGGGVDTRRLKYWLKFVNLIEDMWFMLGADAYHDRSAGFVEMRSRMKGRLKAMTGGPSQNNAFVMRIGGYQFIEFGSKGNACYIYPPEALVFTDQQVVISIPELKRGRDRLSHISDWEWTFDQRMRRIFGRDILRERDVPSGGNGGVVLNSPLLPVKSIVPMTPHAVQPAIAEQPASTPAATSVPETKSVPDIWVFLESCQKAGLASRIVDSVKPVVWLSKDAIKVQNIAVHLARLGFRYVEDPSQVGFWHVGKVTAAAPAGSQTSQPESPAPTLKQVRGPDMASFLAACREAGIDCRMAQPGTVWLSKEAIKVPHIASELAKRGFRYIEDPLRVGFWHGDKGEVLTSPGPGSELVATSSPGIQPPASSDSKEVDLSRLPNNIQLVMHLCSANGIATKVFNEEVCTVWISKAATQSPDIWRELKRLEFAYESESERLGFWYSTAGAAPSHLHRLYDVQHKKPPQTVNVSQITSAQLPTSTHEKVAVASSKDIASTLSTCDRLGIVWVDLRDRGGNLWIYADAATFPTIAERLELQGFQFSEKKRAYWLPGDE
jgi:hypothetical protein